MLSPSAEMIPLSNRRAKTIVEKFHPIEEEKHLEEDDLQYSEYDKYKDDNSSHATSAHN